MIRLTERFVLEREIGSGGMSLVFLGRDEVLDRPVAIKLLKPGFGETDIGARFRREGRTAASLSHPNIVQVYDAGEGEYEGRETSFIVMEYVPGGDLKDLIDERGVLSGGDLAGLRGVAAGLAHAHARGVIHRDIKPHNILLDENRRPKLADFGIARALDATYATRTGSYLGTALYSAPEQLRGDKVTPKTDVYSLGATLYQAATGQPPFLGSPIEVASQHVSKEPTPPRQLNDAVGESLEPLILDCLKKDPDSRPTADEVRLGLLEAGRGVYDTRAYTEPPIAPPAPASASASAKTKRASPTSVAPTSAAPTSGVARSKPGGARPSGTRPGGAAYGGGDRRRSRWLLATLALVMVLAVIGTIIASTLLEDAGDSANRGAEQNNQQNAQPGGGNQNQEQASGQQDAGQQGSQPDQNSNQQNPGQQGAQQEPSGQQAAQEQPAQEEQQQAEGGLTEEAAEQTIIDHYEVAASEDYQDAWNFLSSRYQQEVGARERWTNQFQTLESVEFTSGPTAQVDGDVATVSFSTVAVHTDGVDRPSLTATLVNENGEWKIDGLG